MSKTNDLLVNFILKLNPRHLYYVHNAMSLCYQNVLNIV